MKSPVYWVTAALTAAIAVTATFLIATTSRGETTVPGFSAGNAALSSPARAPHPANRGDASSSPAPMNGSPGRAGR
jgi:hypothetical protein